MGGGTATCLSGSLGETDEAHGMTDQYSELRAALATCRGTFLMTALFSSIINLLMVGRFKRSSPQPDAGGCDEEAEATI